MAIFSEKAKRLLSNDYLISSDVSRIHSVSHKIAYPQPREKFIPQKNIFKNPAKI